MGRSRTTLDKSGNSESVNVFGRGNGNGNGIVNNKTLCQTFVLASFFLVNSVVNARELVDRLAAEVNSRPVLYSSVVEKVENGPQIKISDYPAPKGASEYERALQDSINFELVLAHCELLEIEISDAEVQAQVGRVLEQNKIDLEQLKQFLSQQGKSYEEYEQDMFEQILLMRFQGRVLLPQVKLTEKDVEAYYFKKHGSKNEALSLDIRKIFISLPSGSEESFLEQKRSLAEEVLGKLADGLDFIEAEKIYSELSDARDEKEAMNVKLNDLDGKIQDAVRPLNEGDYSKPVITKQGIYIFYLQNKHLADSRDFLSKKDDLEFELRQKELTTQTQRWLKEERQKSKVRIISE